MIAVAVVIVYVALIFFGCLLIDALIESGII